MNAPIVQVVVQVTVTNDELELFEQTFIIFLNVKSVKNIVTLLFCQD